MPDLKAIFLTTHLPGQWGSRTFHFPTVWGNILTAYTPTSGLEMLTRQHHCLLDWCHDSKPPPPPPLIQSRLKTTSSCATLPLLTESAGLGR